MAKPFSMEFEGANFARALNDIAGDVTDEDLPLFMRKTMIDLVKKVIKKTPVDTGRARGGWTPYLIDQGVNTSAGPPENASDGDFTEELGGTHQFIEVVNGVEYIVFLEFGSSDQAPGGMVRVTMRQMGAGSDLTKDLAKEIEQTFALANITKRGFPV